jgi:hypothetical protein
MLAPVRSRSAAIFGGSAGSVLRSQGTLGPAGLSRCARGEGFDRFQCLFRRGRPVSRATWGQAFRALCFVLGVVAEVIESLKESVSPRLMVEVKISAVD